MNKKGFTLIELMIVIAIIGVLAAIAIPNFISYRDKSYCSQTESNARTVASAIAEYYSVPTRTDVPPHWQYLKIADDDLSAFVDITMSANPVSGEAPIILINVTDPTSRCPLDYRTASDRWGASDNIYTFRMQ